jgi:uncharacterized membrane protein
LTLGFILLIIVTLLIVFGVTQRVLDKMQLSDRMAILFTALIFIGGLIPDINFGNEVYLNIGGAIIPFALCVYLFIKAGTAKEKIRAIAAAIAGGLIVFFAGRLMPDEPELMIIEPLYLYGILAGIVAYIFGRSRRAALIGGIMGVLLGDIAQGVISRMQGLSVPIRLGSGGALDAVVISGLIAVILADLIGELWERLSKHKHAEDMEFEDGKFVPKKGEST